ncbi:hypothetical protein [Streptomyces violascens]|uniref:hypothetical protein n=1 Tax=Streptomyces violascens TaxID=67381 RepID=UPI0036D12FA6
MTRTLPLLLGGMPARYRLENALESQSREMTVGELVDRLSACDRDAPARLAINPLFPMAHRVGSVIDATDEHGNPVVFIAEATDDSQLGYLQPDVAVSLTWHEPTEAPPRRRRGTGEPSAGQ